MHKHIKHSLTLNKVIDSTLKLHNNLRTVKYASTYTHKSSFKLKAKLGCSADCKLAASLPSRYDASTGSPL